jgi:hypothetical protein
MYPAMFPGLYIASVETDVCGQDINCCGFFCGLLHDYTESNGRTDDDELERI